MRTLLFLLSTIFFFPSAVSAQSLYADLQAHQEGDILTIVLSEQTQASRLSEFEDESTASMRGRADVETPSFQSRFAADARVGEEASSMNETAQRDMLSGRMTATVAGVDEAGNLIVEGERRLNINGVTHIMTLQGRIRPYDIRHNNTILSTQIAGADITYRKAGFTRRFLGPGVLTKMGAVGAIIAAVLVGLN